MPTGKSLSRFAFTTLVFGCIASSGFADYRVCNRTTKDLNVAYGVYYFGVDGSTRKFHSRGWRVLAPDECQALDSSGYRRIWLYGIGKDRMVWDGRKRAEPSLTLCLREDDAFDFDEGVIPNIHISEKVCAANGGVLRSFAEFMGVNAAHVTDFALGATPSDPPKAKPAPRAPQQPKLPPSLDLPPTFTDRD